MKAALTIAAALSCMMTIYAPKAALAIPAELKETALKVNLPIDQNFFRNCLSNLKPHFQATQACVVYKMPAGQRIVADEGVVDALEFVTSWSTSTSECYDTYDRLYTRQEQNGDLLLVTSSRTCLEAMAKRIPADFFGNGASMYIGAKAAQ